MIYSRMAQKQLYKLKYEYKNVYKDILINEHEQPDIVEDYRVFSNKIKELKLYIVEFDKNSAIKLKIYLSDYVVRSNY